MWSLSEFPEHPQLRVLMTADAMGGVFSYVTTLVRALSERRVEVVLATMGERVTPDQRDELAAIPGLILCESTFALEWMDDPWREVDAAGEWLLSLERTFCPDLVHLNGYCHGALPWSVPSLIVAHSSVSSWWDAVFREPAPPRYSEYRTRVQLGLSSADRVVAPTRAMLAALARHDEYSGSALIIPNGVAPEQYRRGRKEAFILAAGRFWDPAKNLHLIASAAGALPWPVWVAGPFEGEVQGVRRLGRLPREQLADFMSRAAIFVHPARYEPFGLSPLEAGLSGCALVLSDIQSLREVWGDAAIYVDPDDRATLVSWLCRLTAEPELLHAFGDRARERAHRYTASRMADEYFALYCELASSRRRRGGRWPARAGASS